MVHLIIVAHPKIGTVLTNIFFTVQNTEIKACDFSSTRQSEQQLPIRSTSVGKEECRTLAACCGGTHLHIHTTIES